MLFGIGDKRRAVEAIIHLWYSASIRPDHEDMLRCVIEPAVEDVVQKVALKDGDVLCAKTFPLANGSLRVVLRKDQWQKLLRMLTTSHNAQKAKRSRTHISLLREDHIDRNLFQIRTGLHRRVSKLRFREQGLLLPFGALSKDFTCVNP